MRMKYLSRLTLLALLSIISSCSEIGGGIASSNGPVAVSKPNGKETVTQETPRQCTTPKLECSYGTGPAGVPCSCWSTEGAPHSGITTK
ncbi:hypothetical protein GCM10007864_04540 [Sinorhizobium fredii]|nr:hypothetical protein GCM10007864_04540 [Sinorhizobium fredii]